MTTSSAYREAFLAGERAFWNGVKRQACPHGPATFERECWRDGWDLGLCDANEDTPREYDTLFQNGGPKVYLQVGGIHSRVILASQQSAERTLENADIGDIVWHRAKRGYLYVWHATHKV